MAVLFEFYCGGADVDYLYAVNDCSCLYHCLAYERRAVIFDVDDAAVFGITILQNSQYARLYVL